MERLPFITPELGKRYLTYGGFITDPLETNPPNGTNCTDFKGDPMCPFRANLTKNGNKIPWGAVYTMKGRHYNDCDVPPNEFDLIKEYK